MDPGSIPIRLMDASTRTVLLNTEFLAAGRSRGIPHVPSRSRFEPNLPAPYSPVRIFESAVPVRKTLLSIRGAGI